MESQFHNLDPRIDLRKHIECFIQSIVFNKELRITTENIDRIKNNELCLPYSGGFQRFCNLVNLSSHALPTRHSPCANTGNE